MYSIKSLYENNKELIHYVVVGALTTIVSLSVYYVCVKTVLNPLSAIQLQLANVISWIAAVTFAYFTNRVYVFNSKNTNISREALSFYLTRIGSLIIDMSCMFLMVTIFSFNDRLAKFIVQFVVMISNYVFSKYFVFKKKV